MIVPQFDKSKYLSSVLIYQIVLLISKSHHVRIKTLCVCLAIFSLTYNLKCHKVFIILLFSAQM